MNLYGITIPKERSERLPLYVNISGGNYDFETQAMSSGCVLSFDTYFGCFSASKYRRYTTVNTVEAVVVTRGVILAELVSSTRGVLFSREISSGKIKETALPFDIAQSGENEIYYLRFTAVSDGSCFYGGVYRTDASPSRVKVAVVTCTFKREEYLLRNASIFDEILKDESSGISESTELFVIDNGRTLEGRLPENDKIHLVYNKNTGGSGGFTRGIIEAMKRRNEFTHVLLMDDDVDIDVNVLIKTVTLLSLLKDGCRDYHIAGGMLRLHDPVSQFEAGARRAGVNLSNKSLKLNTLSALSENDREEKADYGGWWYFCMPMSVCREDNLPLPYFIKDDDVEYSLRNKAKIIVMNGIGIWHQDFSLKYIPYLDYYMVRNGLITNTLHGLKTTSGGTNKYVFERICRSIIFKMPQANRFCTMAIRDYLKGADFLLETDCEKLNTSLRAIGAGELPELSGTDKENRKAMLRAVFTKAFWKVLGSYIAVGTRYILFNKRARESYLAHAKELHSLANWEKVLFGK